MKGPRLRRLAGVGLFLGIVLLVVLGIQDLNSRCLPLDLIEGEVAQVAWLNEANVVAQQVRADANGLSAISLRLDHPPADGLLSMSLSPVGDGGSEGGWSAPVVGKDGVFTLYIPPQQESAGKEYQLALRAPVAGLGPQAGLWVYLSDQLPGELRLNALPTGGDLVYRLCYRPSSWQEQGELLADHLWERYEELDVLLYRLSQYKPFFFKRSQWLGLFLVNLFLGSWLVFYFLSQLAAGSGGSLRRSARWALWVNVVALLLFGAVGLWGDRLDSVTKLKAQSYSGTEAVQNGATLVYDFSFAVLGDPNLVVEAPEAWYVNSDWVTIGADSRPVLRMHAPATVIYRGVIEEGTWLQGAAAMDPEVWSPEKGDGVLFQVIISSDQGEETVFYSEVDPKNLPEQRRWHDFEVDLGEYQGQEVEIRFLTFPGQSNDWDWAVWGAPALLVDHDQ